MRGAARQNKHVQAFLVGARFEHFADIAGGHAAIGLQVGADDIHHHGLRIKAGFRIPCHARERG